MVEGLREVLHQARHRQVGQLHICQGPPHVWAAQHRPWSAAELVATMRWGQARRHMQMILPNQPSVRPTQTALATDIHAMLSTCAWH